MDVLLQALVNPGEMSGQQWLMIAIILFVIVGVAYMAWRLYKLILAEQKSTYVPNIGRKRLNTMQGNDEQKNDNG